MRVLVIAPHSFFVDRGSPIDVDILIRALSERGDHVDLVCYPGGADRDYPGVTIHRPRTSPRLHDIGPGFSFKKLRADVPLFRTVLRLVRKHRYDVVHAGEEAAFMAMAVKARYGIPYIYDMDSSIAQQMVEQIPLLGRLSPVLDWFEARAIRGGVAVAPVCHALADLARERGAAHVVTLHDISQLPDPDRDPDGLFERRWGVTRPVLLYVGNLQPYQGVDLLLEAFALAVERGSELDLVVVGGSADHIAAYEEKARELAVEERTRFTGPWPSERLGELLAEARILTAPRIRGVNTPQKIFPYLHSGRPVLVTDLPTHSQILDSTVAQLAPPDPEGFAESLLALERDEERQRALGRAGREFVERNHTFPAHRARVDELYGHVEETIRTRSLTSV